MLTSFLAPLHYTSTPVAGRKFPEEGFRIFGCREPRARLFGWVFPGAHARIGSLESGSRSTQTGVRFLARGESWYYYFSPLILTSYPKNRYSFGQQVPLPLYGMLDMLTLQLYIGGPASSRASSSYPLLPYCSFMAYDIPVCS